MLRLAVPLSLGALLLTAGVTAATPPRQSAHARMQLVRRQPLTVQGRSFHRRERVRVVLRMATTNTVRRVRATRAGRFTVRFRGVRPGPCVRFTVVATGRRGSLAILAGVARPHCLSPTD
jgi:hypothetical protein